ncbi:unannotated protein [freshwater metagenome]|uniref:tRNA (guanine(46)-N(7))-methyltransferase n=1 Tax=freshwater metagenome TaxID=449393 RepID=A0A6J5ZUM1_9ZZZZ
MPRRIRTFHARHGRLSSARIEAIERIVPEMTIHEIAEPVDLRLVFPERKVVIDFGCGMGHHTLALAAEGFAVLAIDVHTAGIARIASYAHEHNLSNVRVYLGDGQDVLDSLSDSSVDEVHVLFPDPWPKPRYHKRRLIHPEFLESVHRVLVAQGIMLIVTDDDSYASHISTVLKTKSDFAVNDAHKSTHVTRYHRRAESLGNTIHRFTLTALKD